MVTWSGLYAFLFLYRCSLSWVGQTLLPTFTTLGDSNQYQDVSGFRYESVLANITDSNIIIKNLGALFNLLTGGNVFLINVCYQTVAFYGLYRVLEALPTDLRKIVILLLFFPSFSLWTSIAGKESVIVFALGIVCAFIINIYSRDTKSVNLLLLLFALYILWVFKWHYLIPIVFLIGAEAISRRTREYTFIAISGSLLSVWPLYYFRDRIDELSYEVLPHHLAGDGRSSREAFWVETYDVFVKAPEGIYKSFVGPTMGEAIAAANPLHVVSFVESVVLLATLFVIVLVRLTTVPLYNLLISLFAAFWVLFPNYPFGVMNPGTAVRYRSGYILLIFVIVIFFMSRNTLIRWRNKGDISHSET